VTDDGPQDVHSNEACESPRAKKRKKTVDVEENAADQQVIIDCKE
jgi:hypothetical protein